MNFNAYRGMIVFLWLMIGVPRLFGQQAMILPLDSSEISVWIEQEADWSLATIQLGNEPPIMVRVFESDLKGKQQFVFIDDSRISIDTGRTDPRDFYRSLAVSIGKVIGQGPPFGAAWETDVFRTHDVFADLHVPDRLTNIRVPKSLEDMLAHIPGSMNGSSAARQIWSPHWLFESDLLPEIIRIRNAEAGREGKSTVPALSSRYVSLLAAVNEARASGADAVALGGAASLMQVGGTIIEAGAALGDGPGAACAATGVTVFAVGVSMVLIYERERAQMLQQLR